MHGRLWRQFADICKQINIKNCVFGHSELEFPAFLNWCMEHLPENCDIINTGQNIEWLVKHPNMLFPANSALVSRWYDIVQKTAIKQYCRKHELDMILVGHRKADGNYVGQNNICSNNSGVTRYSPLADWPHELILAYIHYNHIPLPPIYGWKDGYRCGTHSWPSRMSMKSVEAGWKDVYEIDPSIVLGVADKIDSAAQFLKGVSV